MIELLEQALQAARGLPAELQDDIARVVLHLSRTDDAPIVLSVDEHASFAASKAGVERGKFATDDQLRSVWAKHGL